MDRSSKRGRRSEERASVWTGFDPAPAPLAINRRFTQRQEDLLQKLEQLVFTEGFAHLRVADIRTRIGCAWATLYKIAPSRDQLILLIVDRWYQRLIRDSQRAASRHDDPVALLTEWLEIFRDAVAGHTGRFANDADRNVAVSQLAERYDAYNVRSTARAIEIGIELGAIAKIDPVIAAHVWLGAASHLLRAGLTNGGTSGSRNTLAEFHRIFFNGLLPRASGRDGRLGKTRGHP